MGVTSRRFLMFACFRTLPCGHQQPDQQHCQHGQGNDRCRDDGVDPCRVRRDTDMFLALPRVDTVAAHQQAMGIDAVGRAGHQGNVVLPLYGL